MSKGWKCKELVEATVTGWAFVYAAVLVLERLSDTLMKLSLKMVDIVLGSRTLDHRTPAQKHPCPRDKKVVCKNWLPQRKPSRDTWALDCSVQARDSEVWYEPTEGLGETEWSALLSTGSVPVGMRGFALFL